MSRKQRGKTPENFTKLHTEKKQFTLEEIGAALTRNDGRVYVTAKELGITARAIYDRMNNHPQLKEIVEDARGELVDLAESALKKKVLEGDTAAAIFVSKTLGKERGYTERQEITGANGAPIPVIAFKWTDEGDNGGHETD